MLDVAVFDLETTGLFPRADRVLEIGIVRLSPEGEVRARFETLLNPERDVGPVSIHGIRASDVIDAPAFREVAGAVFELLADTVVVGHNVLFDLRFLGSEAVRSGWTLPPAPFLDTMRVSDLAGYSSHGRSLRDRCAAAGIINARAHSALADAEATATLFFHCLARATDRVRPLFDGLAGAPRALWPDAGVSRAPVCRRRAAELAARPETYLGRLVARLPEELVTEEGDGVIGYYALLDRALEDRLISEAEANALVELALELGLTRAEVVRAHHSYLDGLICAALRDGVISDDERRDLTGVAHTLGIGDDVLARRMTAAERALARRASEPRAEARDAVAAPTAGPMLRLIRGGAGEVPAPPIELAGKRVCFTGESMISVGGAPLTRSRAEELAEGAGLVPTSAVTRTTDLLVVADLATMSSKAKKARSYGIPIITEHELWAKLGVRFDHV